MKFFSKKPEESEGVSVAEDAENTQSAPQPDEETKRRIIEEYLKDKTDAAAAPAAAFVSGGAIPVTPRKKPKTVAEAALYVREMMKENKGE